MEDTRSRRRRSKQRAPWRERAKQRQSFGAVRKHARERVLYHVATLVPHCAVNRAPTNSSQDPPVLGCCQQPTKSSGAASFRCFGGHFSPKSLWRAARPGSRCRRGSDTARYLGSEVGKKVAQPTPATRIVDRGRCTLLKQCTYIVRDLGQQPTTWMGTGCCSTGGNQQRSQQCAEQVLQPGKEPARLPVFVALRLFIL